MTITSKSQAFSLKGRMFTMTVLKLSDKNISRIFEQVEQSVQQAPSLFTQAPIVLDLQDIECDSVDIHALIMGIKEQGLLPVAVQTQNPTLAAAASAIGLANMAASSQWDKEYATAETKPSQMPDTVIGKTVASPVRSGQQVVAKHSDLIIQASVSPGAELLADGNIHVYGALRGRALAGINGNEDTTIYCQSLEAELVSIAGFYLHNEELPMHKKPCRIFLKDESIHVTPL